MKYTFLAYDFGMPRRIRLEAADIYAMLRRIPTGKVTTYGDIAAAVGHPGASRAVGRILNRNPNPVIVPCHRVVRSDGTVGGYAFGKSRKMKLLAGEGLRFTGEYLNDFPRHRIPVKQLR